MLIAKISYTVQANTFTAVKVEMKFVALLSGGKDSCYNIMKCLEQGHELVCLANLMPDFADGDEINSFMYQSAAHNTIEGIADCIGVPLLRKTIKKKAVIQSLDYSQDISDEVEDMYELLCDVLVMYSNIST